MSAHTAAAGRADNIKVAIQREDIVFPFPIKRILGLIPQESLNLKMSPTVAMSNTYQTHLQIRAG